MTAPLFLTDGDVVNLDGKTFTVKELKACVIDSMLYQKHLQDVMEMEESL